MKLPENHHHRNDSSHKDEHGHHNHRHGGGDFTDYTDAVSEYKKVFRQREMC
jgi:carbon-monoxide dehydrogenase catalytic subunit